MPIFDPFWLMGFNDLTDFLGGQNSEKNNSQFGLEENYADRNEV